MSNPKGFRSFFLVFLMLATSAFAYDPFVVEDIKIEGLQRTDPGAVFARLPISVGSVASQEVISGAIREIFAMGYFSDVQVQRNSGVVVFKLLERPWISSISFYGLKEFKEDFLRDALAGIGIKEGQVLNAANFDLAEQALKEAYLSKGKYGVEVTSTLTPLERNRIGISFTVFEGLTALIKSIDFIGNDSVHSDVLLDEMSLSPPSVFSWYTKSDRYSKQKLQGDIESIRSFYLDKGYINFDFVSNQVSVSPDKEGVYITLGIQEGDQFKFGGISIAGDREVPHDELLSLVDIQPGQLFSRSRLNIATSNISNRLADEGFANARVNAIPQLDMVNKVASFTLYVDAGRRIYVRRINVSGNSRTSDNVIRREMRQLEGDFYSSEKIKRSKQRLDLLGFFSQVSIDTKPVAGDSDKIDLEVHVVEMQTGSFTAGLGFSSEEKVMLQLGLTNTNIFGTGNSLALNISSGSVNETYSATYKDPFINDFGVSRSVSVFNRSTDYTSLSVSNYSETSTGANVDYGIPIGEYDKIFLGAGFEQNDLNLGPSASEVYQNFVNINGDNNSAVSANLGWMRDRRDSAILTSDGTLQSANASFATPIGDLQYYSLNYQLKYYIPVGKFSSLASRFALAYSDDYNDKQLPFYKNFYAGGTSTIRGFQSSSLGPTSSDGSSIGGKRRILTGVEYFTPIPGIKDDKSVRLSAFLDAGNVETSFDDVISDMRYAVGAGINWFSPIGPIRLSFAKPLNAKTSDKTEFFQFSLGSLF